MRRLAVLAMLGSLGCGSRPATPAAPAPESMNQTVAQFLAAVHASDFTRMGTLWGTERGPAAEWMKPEELKKRVTVIQKYLAHDGYRVLEGPLAVPGHEDQRAFRVELQRAMCTLVQPIDVIRVKRGGWLVYDVHLENASNPAMGCRPPTHGTGS
jgi:hypothetical protein